MATYTVKAPDGKTITLQGPDGASQDDIISQAQALYKPQAAAPVAASRPSAQPNEFLNRYNQIRNGLAAKFTDPNQKTTALARFDSDPRAQSLRKAAGLAPLSTRQQEVQAVAKKSAGQSYREAGEQAGANSSPLQSIIAAASKGLFGIPQHMQAALYDVAPSALTGIPKNATYSNILQTIQGRDDAATAAHPWYGVPAEIAAGLVGGGLVGGAIKEGGALLAANGAPILARAGNILQELGTLRKGQKLANAAKLAATGGAAGAAQAAGTGGDVPEGAVEGAVAAPAVVASASALGRFVLRPAADILHLSSAGSYLRRFTTATTQEMQQRLAEFRAKTGAEPTLLELLPSADRNRLVQNTVAGRDPAIEQASNAIRDRAANVQPEMANVVQSATEPQRVLTQQGMVRALTDANGGTPVPGDDAMALRATKSPTDMLSLRREESQRIMAPHDQAQVAEKFTDLIPQHPVIAKNGDITYVESDPEVSRALRSVAGNAPGTRNFNVQDITNMISDLRDDAAHGGIEGRAADRAAHHLMDVMGSTVPEAAGATQQMRTAYAAHSRMAEGMGEGWQQRLRDEIQVGISNNRARGVQNAYDTEEGVAGRQVGQTNRLLSDLSGTPQNAVSNTINLARNGNPAIAENLGQTAADKIQSAASEQAQSMEALSSAQRTAQSGEGTAIHPEDITTGLLALGPHPFAKARILRKLMSASILPAGKARVVVDMMFSQDPRLTARAIKAIGNEPNGAKFMKYLSSLIGQASGNATNSDGTGPPDEDPLMDNSPSVENDITGPEVSLASGQEQPATAGPSAYDAQLQSVYQNESPDLQDLIDRVEHQESRGNQGAVSKTGATGVMQVMPGTGPEAAQLAGVPWDEQAFKTDASYNKLLGIAYLSELLRKYDGNVAKALAAYNAGPRRVDAALMLGGDDFLSYLPGETQDYVSRIG